MEYPALASGLSVVIGDSLYYIGDLYTGGASVQRTHSSKIYVLNNGWKSYTGSPSIFTPRSGHSGTAIDGFIFIFGGQNESEGAVFSSSFKLDPVNFVWTKIADLPEPMHSSSCISYNSKAIIYGGANHQGPSNSLIVYNPGKS